MSRVVERMMYYTTQMNAFHRNGIQIKNTQYKNVSETIENIEVGIYNNDVTPAPEALSSSILDLDVCAALAV